jgi:hypothetical protein
MIALIHVTVEVVLLVHFIITAVRLDNVVVGKS